MSEEVKLIVADEGENFLGWRVARNADGWLCRIWVLHHNDDEPVDPSSLSIPEREADFEANAATQDEAIEFLAGEDAFLRNAAIGLLADLPSK